MIAFHNHHATPTEITQFIFGQPLRARQTSSSLARGSGVDRVRFPPATISPGVCHSAVGPRTLAGEPFREAAGMDNAFIGRS